MKIFVQTGAVALVLLVAATAYAQKELPITKGVDSKLNSEKLGWYPRLTIGASVAFAHADKVVGAQDGQTWNIGINLDGGMDYFSPEHEWRTAIALQHVQTMTPAIPRFVKTADSLVFDTIYLYHIPQVSWLGPFMKFKLDTALFPGENVQERAKTFRVTEPSGQMNDRTPSASIKLTEAGAPLRLEESVGLFAQPVAKTPVTVELRMGIGARQVFVQNGLAVNDDAATLDIVELKRLEDYQQIGGELFAGVSGTVVWEELGESRPLTYAASAEVLLPFHSSLQTDRTVDELSVLTFQARLGIKLFSWMSLDYAFRAIREPLILEDFQIQNNLLLSFQYALL